ncbi:MAG: hypothetical protein ACRDJ3_06295 [Solirubrobacteraceae bacterium]
MVREIPLLDLTKGQAGVLQGNHDDRVVNNRTVMIDPRSGREFPQGEYVGNLPQDGVVQIPRTTWYTAGPRGPATHTRQHHWSVS